MSTVALEAKATSPSSCCISLVLNLGESKVQLQSSVWKASLLYS